MRPPLARVGALFAGFGLSAGIWIGANLGIKGRVFAVAALFLPDDVSVLGISQPVCGGLAHRDDRLRALSAQARPADLRLCLRRPLRGGCRAHPAFPRRCLSASSNGAAFRAAPRRRLRKLSSAKSRCVPARPIADRSPPSSLRREARCDVNCWPKPSSRSSPTSSNDFFKSWQPTPAARMICSTYGGSISRPCRSTDKDFPDLSCSTIECPATRRRDAHACRPRTSAPRQYRHVEGHGCPIRRHRPPLTEQSRAHDTVLRLRVGSLLSLRVAPSRTSRAFRP